MSSKNDLTHLPAYQPFSDTISILDLPISGSELHGIMCGYLCAGAASEGESYLRALTPNRKDEAIRAAALAIFEVYTISQHQLVNFDFEFQLFLPDDHEPLAERARAFSEWCEGFMQGMTISGIGYEQFQEEESQEALQHIQEFAELEYESLQVDEDEDERALMEVSEYARMAVLRLYGDLIANDDEHGSGETSH
jgi:yecA family protein